MKKTLIAVALLGCAGLACAGDTWLIDDFEDGLNPLWEEQVFKGRTEYQVVESDGSNVLQADSRAAASGLIYRLDADPNQWPILSWRWKVSGTIEKGDARAKATDDYAARIYVVFPSWIPLRTRVLNYVWANRLPEGAQLPSAYLSRSLMIAVRSGSEHAGKWVAETRNLIEDFRSAFGDDPPKIGAIAVMTDTDQTGEAVQAYYDDIRLQAAEVKQ